MTIERTEVVWIEARSDYSTHELLEMSNLPRELIDELVDCGALPVSPARATRCFEAEGVVLARAAGRLRDHFELDGQGLAVALSLLRRVRRLEAELDAARAGASPTD